MAARQSDPSAPGWHGPERRKLFGRILNWLVDPWLDYVYFRFDLNGPDRRPAHGKVVAFWVLVFVTTVAGALWGWIFSEAGLADPHRGTLITAASSLTIFLVFASFGLPGIRIWAENRPGAAGGDIAKAAEADAAVAAEIEKRRQLAGGDHEPTP